MGQARISNSHVRILHKIDIKDIESVIQFLDVAATEKVVNNKILGPLIKVKQEKLRGTYKKLKNSERTRFKRWNSLGTAWKYISGSPDANDLKIINTTTNLLIEQNDKQIRINKQFEERIVNLTKTISLLVSNNNLIREETLDGFDSVNLLFNIDELINQLEVIEEAVTLARFSIPSSRLVTNEELQAAQQFITNNGLRLDSLDNVLDIASAYVMHNENSLIYALKIPRIKDVSYELNYVEPIINNGSRVYLHSNYILIGPNTYYVKTQCPKIRNLYVCNNPQLEALEECAQQLLNGNSAECPTERAYGKNLIKRINEFNIVVSNANITMSSNCLAHQKQLFGSFLIQFSNCSVNLNGEEFSNLDTDIPARSFIPTIGIKVNSTKTIDRIPLEYLQIYHIDHREHIKKLNLTTTSIQGTLGMLRWLSFGSFSIITPFVIGFIFIWVTRKLASSCNTSKSTMSKEEQQAVDEVTEARTTVPSEEEQQTADEATEARVTVPSGRQPRMIPQQ